MIQYEGSDPPPLSLSEDGYLLYNLSGESVNLGLVKGPDGIQGPPGQDGAAGEPGKAATIKIGSVSSGDAPMVSNSGSETEAVFDFTLPVGPEGPAGPQGEPGKDGQQLWAAYIDENGHLIVQYEGTEAPPLRLDENGHLLYDANGQMVDLGLARGEDGASGEPGKDGLGVPEPSLADAGKVPAVTADGTGYELVPMGGNVEKEWTLIADVTPTEDVVNFEFTEDAHGNPFKFTEVLLYGKKIPSAIPYFVRFLNQDDVSMCAFYGFGNFTADKDITVTMERVDTGSLAQVTTGYAQNPMFPVITNNPYEFYTTLKLYFQGKWPANTQMLLWGR